MTISSPLPIPPPSSKDDMRLRQFMNSSNNGQGRSAISSMPLYSSIESAQFSIYQMDDVSHSRRCCPPGSSDRISDRDRVSTSSSSSSDAADYVSVSRSRQQLAEERQGYTKTNTNMNSSNDVMNMNSSNDVSVSRSRHHLAEEIVRPGNPIPVVSSSSSSDPYTRSNQESDPPHQSLLKRSQRHYGNNDNGPSSKIYPPKEVCCPDQPKPRTEYDELHDLLQSDISSLQSRHQDGRKSLKAIDKKTKIYRSELVRTLATCRGDAKDPSFVSVVEVLEQLRAERSKLDRTSKEIMRVWTNMELCTWHSSSSPTLQLPLQDIAPEDEDDETRKNIPKLEGQWFTLTKPTYPDCLGFNEDGNPMYTLGRMSFEMFRPGNLVVSIEALFNPIMEVIGGNGKGDEQDEAMFSVPKTLQEEVRRILEDGETEDGQKPVLMTYHIVTAFIIEPHSPSFGPSSPNAMVKAPIRGIMTTQGYALTDPTNPDRMSVWFSGGKMECGESRHSSKFKMWKKIFGDGGGGKSKKKKPSRTFREGLMVGAARLFMGAEGYNDGMDEKTGEMSYTFSRPMGGHGKAFVDIIHLDDHHRVMRGHAGTLYVFARVGADKKHR